MRTKTLPELRAQARAADDEYARMSGDPDVTEEDLERQRTHANKVNNELVMAEAQARGYPLGGLTDVRFPLPGRS
jgi:phage-related tail protein